MLRKIATLFFRQCCLEIAGLADQAGLALLANAALEQRLDENELMLVDQALDFILGCPGTQYFRAGKFHVLQQRCPIKHACNIHTWLRGLHASENQGLVLDPPHERAGEVFGGRPSPKVRRPDCVFDQYIGNAAPDSVCKLRAPDMFQHQASGKEQCQWVRDPLPGDIRSGSVHRLKDRSAGTDVGAGRHAKAAYKTSDFIRENVPE
jgi:hypothetical protein